MGRPLNKKFFGDPASAGYQLTLVAYLDAAHGAESCYILSQKGSRTYLVAAVADHSRTGRVILQEATPAAVGQAQMAVVPANGSGGALPTEYARTVEAHIVKTWEDHTYDWYVGVSVSSLDAGQATLTNA